MRATGVRRGTPLAGIETSKHEFGGRAGFSLVELLVAIGVIAVLVAISLPALRGARERSLDTQDLANMRTIVQDMAAWSNDHADVFPNGGGMTAPYLTIVRAEGEIVGVFDYYEHVGGWIHVLRAHFGEYSPAWGVARGYPAKPFYSNAMISDPRLWDACPTSPDRRWQFARTVSTSETAYPSAKGLLVTGGSLGAQVAEQTYSIAMVDGSAARYEVDAILRGAYWEFCGSRLAGATPPVVHTVRGVLGRDVRN